MWEKWNRVVNVDDVVGVHQPYMCFGCNLPYWSDDRPPIDIAGAWFHSRDCFEEWWAAGRLGMS